MRIYHNSHRPEYRSPFGACEAGSEIVLSLDVKDCDPVSVRLLVIHDGSGTEQPGDMSETEPGRYSITMKVPSEPSLLWYCFVIEYRGSEDDADVHTVYYGNYPDGLGGEGAVYYNEPKMYQVTVYVRSEVPEWYKNGIVYQIFPGRFARDREWAERCKASAEMTNAVRSDVKRFIEGDWYRTAYYGRDGSGKVTGWPLYGGSLRGIKDKLEYLASLGVTAIYLNPVFDSVSNHHYDTCDYMTIDPSLGTEEDFRELADAARARGIRLILDGVFSHTGDDSIYFDKYGTRGGNGAYNNPYSPYWSWFKFDKNEKYGYKSWWGIEDLPEVDEDDPGFKQLITGSGGVIEKWMKAGASGWRLDVADELPDDFIREIRKRVRETDPDGLLIGEVWEDASNKISYGERRSYFAGDELDGTMNYPMRSALLDYVNYTISSGRAGRKLMSLMENYPEENFYSALNIIGSHDRERILTAMAADQDYDSAVKKVRLLSVIQYALPGVPCLYYGDEAGLRGGADPANRSGFPWGRESHELSFHYRMLGLLYREHPVLAGGRLKMLSGSYGISEDVMAFIRSDENEKIIVLANRSYGPADVDLSSIPEAACYYAIDLLTGRELPVRDGRLADIIHMDRLSAMLICIPNEVPDNYIRERSAGVICHISSLGKPVLGKPARDFVDFLVSAGMKVWQMLPVNPPGLGDSPYSSSTGFAGNPAFINYDELPDDSGFEEFCDRNMFWLTDYTAYTLMKEISGEKVWSDWYPMHRDADPDKLLKSFIPEYSDRIDELVKEQYYFYMQWNDLHEYARERGIRLMGDLPIYIGHDSADVWANKEIFRIDGKGTQVVHAGVPADGFSADGQDWGNPLYDWDKLREDGYKWWIRRIRQCAERFDILRLDHFRGFSEYYAIPEGGRPAEGLWIPGPGLDFFRAVRRMLDEEGLELEILAEDLGHLDPGVKNLLSLTGLSGMDVWQFSADEIRALPPEKAAQRACYSGTHDNNTMKGYMKHRYPDIDDLSIGIKVLDEIRHIYSGPAVLAMIQLQDLFLLGEEARMNVPGVAEGNWTWKIPGDSIEEAFPDADERASWFRELAVRTGRI